MFSPEFAPACLDKVSLFTMLRESVHGCAGAQLRSQFSTNGQSEQSLLPRDVLNHLGDAFKEL